MSYQPRDFIETPEGLIFAVVDSQLDAGRVPCFLRYRRDAGQPVKLGTEEANAWLAAHGPRYLFHSARLDASLHGVPPGAIRRHYRPRQRLAELRVETARDAIEAKARHLLAILESGGLPTGVIGITGSVLIGAQHPASDLDFVIYERAAFHRAREVVRDAIATGELAELTPEAWRDAYERRGCELSFAEYLWHERRKHHKGLCDGTKFDLTLVTDSINEPAGPAHKRGAVRVITEVTDAERAFDFPARYRLAHPEIAEALSFSHTYAGQALPGERVEIAGQLEETASGRRRIIVGSTREALGEFIKVQSPSPSTQRG
jgi:predicted nucleotidyltransferase